MEDDSARIKARIEELETEAKDYSAAVENELSKLSGLKGELSGIINELARIRSNLENKDEDKDKDKEIEDIEDAIAILSEELESKKKEAEGIFKGEQYLTELKYLKADFENYKRRMAKEKREAANYALECFITELLPIKDSLEAAIMHAKTNNKPEGLVKGVEMTMKQFEELLKRAGLEEIKAEGEKFDPFRHEVVSREEKDMQQENTITEVVRKGYVFHDKVLRPALVKLAMRKTSNTE
ncbi:MAG: nucleotide exchange factor GrpE [Methanophagales archaeon]|nr:nucleotide exchange factor GrpE [Methanophagales archaeon]MCW3139563.1 nucleotide exchange factor GrpE [Methanophagales archaeon]MCW7072329.1 nucleotide exchange factor GrpE [Methanophagales archaeon]